MPADHMQTNTYLFGLFADLVDSVALEGCLKHYENSQDAFAAVSSILVSAILQKTVVVLQPDELTQFVSLLAAQTSKEKVRHWLDMRAPDATLQLAEAAEMALFGISELQ